MRENTESQAPAVEVEFVTSAEVNVAWLLVKVAVLDKSAVLDELAVKVVAGPSLMETTTLFCLALMKTGGIILEAREAKLGRPPGFVGVGRVGKLGVFGGLIGKTGRVGMVPPALVVALPEVVGAVCERCIGTLEVDEGVEEGTSELDDEAGGGSETASHSANRPRALRPPSLANRAWRWTCASATALATMRIWSGVSDGCASAAFIWTASILRPRPFTREPSVWRRGARMGPKTGRPPTSPPRVSNKPLRARNSRTRAASRLWCQLR